MNEIAEQTAVKTSATEEEEEDDGQEVKIGYDVQALRATEFKARLESTTYLDWAGSGLYTDSMIQENCRLLQSTLLSNPHSGAGGPASTTTSRLVSEARDQVLRWFNTTRDQYSVIFTSGTTAAFKMVLSRVY